MKRRLLSHAERSALAADIQLRRSLTSKELMRKYGVSRSFIDTVARESKTLAAVPHETKQDAFNILVLRHTAATHD